ncbi:unnamed protein product [Prorocentrum cordatum]|uniref:Uncharacterized protein n=1 Tax=Prorocentrum cordatum TaxID=2364126 RepID=A0ABN9X8E6_9DINO|nr:unnamed protein product [Polarella glacialis]
MEEQAVLGSLVESARQPQRWQSKEVPGRSHARRPQHASTTGLIMFSLAWRTLGSFARENHVQCVEILDYRTRINIAGPEIDLKSSPIRQGAAASAAAYRSWRCSGPQSFKDCFLDIHHRAPGAKRNLG